MIKTYYQDANGTWRPEGFKEKFKVNARKVLVWTKENWEIVTVIGIPVVAGSVKGISAIFRNAAKRKTLRQEQDLKELYIYDRSLGMYHKLRKKINNSQALEIKRRKASGEKLAVILSSMKVLA